MPCRPFCPYAAACKYEDALMPLALYKVILAEQVGRYDFSFSCLSPAGDIFFTISLGTNAEYWLFRVRAFYNFRA